MVCFLKMIPSKKHDILIDSFKKYDFLSLALNTRRIKEIVREDSAHYFECALEVEFYDRKSNPMETSRESSK